MLNAEWQDRKRSDPGCHPWAAGSSFTWVPFQLGEPVNYLSVSSSFSQGITLSVANSTPTDNQLTSKSNESFLWWNFLEACGVSKRILFKDVGEGEDDSDLGGRELCLTLRSPKSLEQERYRHMALNGARTISGKDYSEMNYVLLQKDKDCFFWSGTHRPWHSIYT